MIDLYVYLQINWADFLSINHQGSVGSSLFEGRWTSTVSSVFRNVPVFPCWWWLRSWASPRGGRAWNGCWIHPRCRAQICPLPTASAVRSFERPGSKQRGKKKWGGDTSSQVGLGGIHAVGVADQHSSVYLTTSCLFSKIYQFFLCDYNPAAPSVAPANRLSTGGNERPPYRHLTRSAQCDDWKSFLCV